jgi:hypothetical protein
MAITTTFTRFTWASANSKSITHGANATSDALGAPATNCIGLQIELKANNGGTPASGDTVDFYLLQQLGNVDGGGAIYDTVKHAQFLGRLDTNLENPAQITLAINPTVANLELYAVNNASSNSITVSGGVLEKDG